MLSDSIRNYEVLFFLSVLLISIDVLKLLLLSFDRNQNEARTRGGLQAFCELLRTTMDDKVSLLSFGSSLHYQLSFHAVLAMYLLTFLRMFSAI